MVQKPSRARWDFAETRVVCDYGLIDASAGTCPTAPATVVTNQKDGVGASTHPSRSFRMGSSAAEAAAAYSEASHHAALKGIRCCGSP